MPRLLLPLPPRSMVPVEAKPAAGVMMLPRLVSMATPMALSVPVLAMKPLLMTELLLLRVTAATSGVVMPTPPPASMVILPLVMVLIAVEVLVLISVSARAVARAAASMAAAAAESIKRCLINSAS